MPVKKLKSADDVRSFILKTSIPLHTTLKIEAERSQVTLTDYLIEIIKEHRQLKIKTHDEINNKKILSAQGNKKFNLRLSPELHTEIKIEAIKSHVTLNDYLLDVILKRKKI